MRLPTMRNRVGELITISEKEQLTYRGFIAELLHPVARTGQSCERTPMVEHQVMLLVGVPGRLVGV